MMVIMPSFTAGHNAKQTMIGWSNWSGNIIVEDKLKFLFRIVIGTMSRNLLVIG